MGCPSVLTVLNVAVCSFSVSVPIIIVLYNLHQGSRIRNVRVLFLKDTYVRKRIIAYAKKNRIRWNDNTLV